MTTQRPGWRFLFLWLIAGGVAWALLIYPMYVIWPFRHQSQGPLLAALAVTRYRWIAMVLAVALMAAAVLRYWSAERRGWRRFFSAIAVLTVVVPAVLSRINVYEIMFHPAGAPVAGPAAESKLDGREMVIAVKLKGAARAYPIRSMSYHHIFNDELAGQPIVATY